MSEIDCRSFQIGLIDSQLRLTLRCATVKPDKTRSQSVQNQVDTTRLGREGPEITRLGLGTWAIGGPYEHGWGPVDDAVSVRTVLHAVDRGLNWLDTAPAYGCGHSEEVVGAALRQLNPSERPLVFTKCGRVWDTENPGKVVSDLRPSSIRQECEASLKRLGVDRIDLYQIHRPDARTGTSIEDSWATLAKLVDEGKVRWIGLSNVDRDLLDRCEAVRHVDSLQPSLSLLDRKSLPLLDWCQEHGTGVIAYSPLASGLLTGAFDHARVGALAPDDWRKRSSKFAEPALTHKLAVVDALRTIADPLGHTVSELALAWVLSRPGVSGAIVGARLPGQVDSWAGTTKVTVSDDTLREIEAVAVVP
ncbi:aldo/keto reductase [Streptomyces sp. NPDC059752]|uniref:aldo/keto reductase n=1 Tax=unclassified Streptomyces TaxID=2593676 RepID=UPI003649C7CC